MRALDRKLLRDLRDLAMPLGAAALVLAAGIAAMIMALSTDASLRRARLSFYEQGRFADVFVGLKRAPEQVADRLAAIPGVLAVETRLVHEVRLETADASATGLVHSLPESGEQILNRVLIRRGRLPEPGSTHEVVVNEAFADANGLGPGDPLPAVINGRRRTLSIVGVGLSPEFVFFVRPGELLPDDRRSAVLWMPRAALEAALDMEGAFNAASMRVDPQASLEEILRRVDLVLDPFGTLGAYGREEHASDRYLRDEFEQLRVMGSVTPAIFLGVGAFLVHVVLGRLVRTQRERLATLKAFGYSNGTLTRHVLLMAIATAALAGAAGAITGWLLGADLTGFYRRVYRFPELDFALDPTAVAAALALAIACSAFGALGALRGIARLAPAEAMQPAAPDRVRGTRLGELVGRWTGVRGRMIVRSVARRPWRSAFGAVGVALSTAVLVVSNFALDSIDFIIDHEYAAARRYGTAVAFNAPLDSSAEASLRGALAGDAALLVEAFRAVPVRIGAGHRSRRIVLLGLPPDATLHRLLDARGEEVALPSEGVLLSEHVAELLGVRPGDSVRVHVLEGRRAEIELPVTGVYAGLVGLTATMDRAALHRAIGESDSVSGAYLREDPALADALRLRLDEMPAVASTASSARTVEAFRATIAENIVRITVMHALFAAVIAFGVVYNTARVAFAEREREFATLRVLGFGRGEVAGILLGELAMLVAIGIPVGLLVGRGLAELLVAALRTESYSFPVVIAPATYAGAALVTVASAAASALIVRRGVTRLDLLATLKGAG